MFHHHPHELVTEILSQIAKENDKPLEKIKCSLLINENRSINHRFWEILDKKRPHHMFTYVGCCAECGSLDLR